MARMIPPGCLPKTPAGEKELFNRLRDDPDTEGWVVLHSLDIKKHQSKIEGELDMVILVPGMGVLCVEVKGCDVSRQDGKWIYPYETSVEGPFKQASRAMHSLRDYLLSKDSSLSGILFFSAVVFTRVNFEEDSPEWHPWQYINRRLFVRRPISINVAGILNHAHEHVKSKAGRHSWYNERSSRPTDEQIRRLITLLRDDFEYVVSPRTDLEQLEQSIQRFTEEQFQALDHLQDNNRIVFRGPAGTGKTFLAMEAARRAAAEGKSVLFVCYNSLLGNWIKGQTSNLLNGSTNFHSGTFHGLLLDLTDEKPPKGASNEYWQKKLPQLAADRLLDDSGQGPVFDILILDEAQDLITDEYLDVLDLLLKGGLAGGNWAFFGDFERQAIYVSDTNTGAGRPLDGLVARAPNHFNYSLRVNCRNAAPIAETLTITSGLAPGYKRVLHDTEGADVDLLFYSSDAEQPGLLKEALGRLAKGFRADEIIILSMRSDDRSCAGTAPAGALGASVTPIRELHGSKAIPFSSIHAFKGLEAVAVIITDIESLEDERSRALLYVGMSRARIRLYMLMRESCRKSYDKILDAGLKKTTRR